MRRAPPSDAVRRHIAAQTRDLTLALLAQDQVARLHAPGLDAAEYAAFLQSVLWVFQAVEDRRRAACAFEPLSLDRVLAALRADLRGLAGMQAAPGQVPVLWLGTPSAILAALYVLHEWPSALAACEGCIAASLPDAPRHFVGAGVSQPLCRSLTAELERHGQTGPGRAALVAAASTTLQALGACIASSRGDSAAGASVPSVAQAPPGSGTAPPLM